MRSVQLDGKTTGFIVEILDSKERYLKTSTGIRIFDNLQIAKITANTYVKDSKFIYHIKCDNGKIIPMDNTQYMGNGKYQAVVDNELIEIVEKRNYSTVEFKYLVFANGDTERTPKEKGPQCYKELYKLLKYCVELELVEDDPENKVTRIKRRRGEFILYLKGTTTQIHIMGISNMMDMNQNRKKNGNQKVFPFMKEMDKFRCFYLYTCKDWSESKRLEGDQRAKNVINRIMERLTQETKEYDDIPFKFVDIVGRG